MNTFKLTVSTPYGNRYCGETYALYVRGAAGDLAVLAGHIPFSTCVKAGKCKIIDGDSKKMTVQISDGLLTVTKSETLLLVTEFTEEETEEE